MPEPSAQLALHEEAPVLDIGTPPETRKREADEISVPMGVEEEADLPEKVALHFASAPPQPKAVPLALPPGPLYERARTVGPNMSLDKWYVWDAVRTLSSHPVRSNASA